MLEVCDSLATLFIGIVFANLTSTIDVKSSFTGFSNMIPWLLFCVLSISSVITKSSLGLRIAYLFMKLFGRNLTGISYSIILTEFLIAPAMPSSTARAASIGFPIITSIAKYVSESIRGVSEQRVGRYMIILYSACSAICSATFATGMVSNALILDVMTNANLGITWISWLKFTVLPCVALLLLLPFVVRVACNPKVRDLSVIQKQAVTNYASLGAITDKEKFIIAVFGLMLVMWVFSDGIGIPVMITTLIGICIFLITGILTPKDILSCSSTFNSVITLGILISFVNNLISSGVIDWFTGTIAGVVDGHGKWTSFSVLSAIYFFSHYFFSGESGRIVALYASFVATGFSLGISQISVAMTMAVFSSMSNVLTHYTSPVSVLMFSSGYISTKKWASCGLVLATFVLAIWLLFVYAVETWL